MGNPQVDYPVTGRLKPVAHVHDIRLATTQVPNRIAVHFTGERGGTYKTEHDMAGAIDLLIKLERAIGEVAAGTGFTDPAYARLVEHRRKRQVT